MAIPLPIDPPSSTRPESAEALRVEGVLLGSLEQLARVALAASRADGAMLLLLGADRRSFTAGRLVPSWMSHDTGLLLRTGVIARAVEGEGGWAAPGVGEGSRGETRDVLNELGVGGLLTAAMIREDGLVIGAVVVVSEEPRSWPVEAVSAVLDVAALATSTVGLSAWLAERAAREQRPRNDMHHDALTGLPSRATFLQRLQAAARRARQGQDQLFAVLFLDVDDFKSVNESMGRDVGDAVLVEVAQRLEGCVRGGDVVARLGGDEFAILLERVTDAREAAVIADRVQQSLRAPLPIDECECTITASLGVALSSSGDTALRPESILRSADMAMFRAKHQGRGRVEMSDKVQHVDALTRLRLESDLRLAIERDEFELHYQPIIRFADGTLVGAEALVRWHHPEQGLLLPDAFVSLAEDTGLIVQLGRWVLRRAIEGLATWEREHAGLPGLTLAINLSAREFAQVDLVRAVADALSGSSFDPSRLHLEITESTIFSQQNVALDTVAALKALGVRIHIDDFGTGYSSLSYLQRLPVDAIKIDRSFVRGIEVEARSRHVVSSLVALAGGIGLDVVAEGVGSAGQVRLLRDMGCQFGQGFHFGKPARGLDSLRPVARRSHTPGPRLASG